MAHHPPPSPHTRLATIDATLAARGKQNFSRAKEQPKNCRRVVAAFEAAAAGGSALVVLDGCLVEELHVHAARRLLALGEAVEASEAEA